MKERPILFSDPMVRALLSGQKTQTRRVVKPLQVPTQKDDGTWFSVVQKHPRWGFGVSGDTEQECAAKLVEFGGCHYGQPGDRLWVREAIRHLGDGASVYSADLSPTVADAWPWKRNFLPPMHCPRGLSRIDLEIVSVRVERLQDISEADAMAEGIQWSAAMQGYHVEDGTYFHAASAVESYRSLWEHINGADSWAANPWVWVIEFRRVQP